MEGTQNHCLCRGISPWVEDSPPRQMGSPRLAFSLGITQGAQASGGYFGPPGGPIKGDPLDPPTNGGLGRVEEGGVKGKGGQGRGEDEWRKYKQSCI